MGHEILPNLLSENRIYLFTRCGIVLTRRVYYVLCSGNVIRNARTGNVTGCGPIVATILCPFPATVCGKLNYPGVPSHRASCVPPVALLAVYLGAQPPAKSYRAPPAYLFPCLLLCSALFDVSRLPALCSESGGSGPTEADPVA